MKRNIITGASAAVLLLSACSCGRSEPKVSAPSEEIVLSRVRSVDRLTLAQMRITKMATIDDIRLEDAQGPKQVVAALVDAVKIGDRKGAYSYDTYMSAYIDLSGLGPGDVRVDTAARTVSLTLPAPRTELTGRDMQIREDHYRVTGLRTAIGPAERAALKEKMNEHLKQEVSTNPEFARMLDANARRRADSYFRELLGDLGYNVEISYR